MSAPTLQDGINKAGSPVRLLWKPNAAPFKVPVIKPEFVGWREEQTAWSRGVAFSDLSHHMFDTFLEGPDVTRLLTAVSANDYESFAVGQAKQFIPVTSQGYIVTDGILMRDGPEKYTLSGVPAAQSWVKYHAQKGGYDVTATTDPDSATRKEGPPVLFRYQVQGSRALELTELAFGGPDKPSRIRELNQIVHPAVIARQEEWMAQVGQSDPRAIALVEAALILEAGAAKRFDRLVVVTCQPQQRIERWARRLKVDREAARREVTRRMAAQLPDEEKIKAADYVIDNSGSLDETGRQVKQIYAELKREAAG